MSARAKPPLCPLCGGIMEWKKTGYLHIPHWLKCQECWLSSPIGETKKDVLKKFEPVLNLKKEATK